MGLLGGGGKDMDMPSPQEYFDEAKGYYANYKQWSDDASSRYKRDLATNRARYGASGGDSPMLEKVNEARTTSYHEEMKDLEQGEHGQFLTTYFNDTKAALKSQVGEQSDSPLPQQLQHMAQDSRGRNQFGSAQYFSDVIPQSLRDQRSAADEAQSFINKNMQTTQIGGKTFTSQRSQVGGSLMDKQTSQQIATSKGTIAAANAATQEFSATVDAMTMDDMFGPVFGDASSEASLEDQAIERAQSGASGRRGGLAEEEKSSWWG